MTGWLKRVMEIMCDETVGEIKSSIISFRNLPK